MGVPSFSGRGGARIGQGAPFDSRVYIVRFWLIQPVGGYCPLSADSTSGGGGGGGGGGAPFSPEGGATHVGGWMNVD